MLLTPKIIESNFLSEPWLHEGSAVVRCCIGRYFSLGLFSSITDSHVGNYCSIGSRVSIGGYSHPTHLFSVHEVAYRDVSRFFGGTIHSVHIAEDSRRITKIGSDVYVGDNAVVLSGVEIGNGAVVGAGSVVTKNIPPYAIAVGNPAQVVRLRFPVEICERLAQTSWWLLSMDELKNAIALGLFSFVGTDNH